MVFSLVWTFALDVEYLHANFGKHSQLNRYLTTIIPEFDGYSNFAFLH